MLQKSFQAVESKKFEDLRSEKPNPRYEGFDGSHTRLNEQHGPSEGKGDFECSRTVPSLTLGNFCPLLGKETYNSVE